jgi:hypothetical protein
MDLQIGGDSARIPPDQPMPALWVSRLAKQEERLEMARLVVALIALSIMSAGSMYWAAAQQTPDQAPGWAASQVKASAYDAFKPVNDKAPSQDCSACPSGGGCCCGGSGDTTCTGDKDKDAKDKPHAKADAGCRGR